MRAQFFRFMRHTSLKGFFRGRARGGDTLLHTLPSAPDHVFKALKAPFLPQELQPRPGHPVKHRLIHREDNQARKRNPNPNFWVRISSGGVGVFHLKGWGPKVQYVPQNHGNQTFLAGCPGILPGYPGGA